MFRRTAIHTFLLALSLAAPAAAAESVYTDFPLSDNKCAMVHPEKANDETEGGSVELVCPGYKDYKVYYDEGDARVSIHYGYLNSQVLENYWESFTPFNSVAEKIEWRLDGKGVPRAAIHRFMLANFDPDTGEASDKLQGQVLVISKVGQKDDMTGCVVGMVDALANKDANEQARKVADEVAPGFKCGKDTAEYHGTRGDKAADLSATFGE